jgi:hypothetical protein
MRMTLNDAIAEVRKAYEGWILGSIKRTYEAQKMGKTGARLWQR